MVEKYSVFGMTCASCVAHVEKAVNRLDGINRCEVNLISESMTVDFDANIIKPQGIMKAVKSAGYKAKPYSRNNSDGADTLLIRFILSLALLLPLMYFSMGHMVSFPMGVLDPHKNAIGFAVYQLVLTSVILGINYKFYISGIKAVLHKSANMDTLVTLGAFAAYIYGIVITGFIIAGGNGLHASAEYAMDLYYESAATIVTLVTLGKFLESKSKARTKSEVEKLVKLKPATATVKRDGEILTINVDDIVVGDTVLIKAGELIPCDGIITSGATTIDSSALTGESIPVEATQGSQVSTATVNLSGAIELEAVRVGADTALSKIIKMVEDAGGSKAPIQKIADKVSGIFVPVVVGISIITLVVWLCLSYPIGFCLERAITVLVISCPCALGLATPVAVMAGTGRAAAYGVLVKNAEVLQRLKDCDIVALDKTATLTEGKPKLDRVNTFSDMTEYDALAIAAALEKTSSHPLANAVTEGASLRSVKVPEAQNVAYEVGLGLTGEVNGVLYALGNEKLAAKYGLAVEAQVNSVGLYRLNKTGKKLKATAQTESQNEQNASSNKVVAAVKKIAKKVKNTAMAAANGASELIKKSDENSEGANADNANYTAERVAQLTISDKIKTTSLRAVKLFKKAGMRSVMITGDNSVTAKSTAQEVGIDTVHDSVMPDGKLAVVTELKKEGVTAMVGDGINDAPALKGADIGIAIGSGTDVAIEAADVVLVKSDLVDVARAVTISHATVKNIKENLFWAFFYNAIGIPLAAGVLYAANILLNPMIAALAMALSSLFVVANSLRLTVMRFDDAHLDRKVASYHRYKSSRVLKKRNKAKIKNQ